MPGPKIRPLPPPKPLQICPKSTPNATRGPPKAGPGGAAARRAAFLLAVLGQWIGCILVVDFWWWYQYLGRPGPSRNQVPGPRTTGTGMFSVAEECCPCFCLSEFALAPNATQKVRTPILRPAMAIADNCGRLRSEAAKGVISEGGL